MKKITFIQILKEQQGDKNFTGHQYVLINDRPMATSSGEPEELELHKKIIIDVLGMEKTSPEISTEQLDEGPSDAPEVSLAFKEFKNEIKNQLKKRHKTEKALNHNWKNSKRSSKNSKTGK